MMRVIIGPLKKYFRNYTTLGTFFRLVSNIVYKVFIPLLNTHAHFVLRYGVSRLQHLKNILFNLSAVE